MFNSKKTVRRVFATAGLCVIAAYASALGFDPQIVVDRAIDSPTLTVRYSGVEATLIELRVNGESLGTRTVSSSKDSGETNFTLNLSELRDGDNDVEITLFDRTGKIVGHDHTNIETAPIAHGPVFLSVPKSGATVKGPVSVEVGFDHSLKDCYVSFFVDGNFKSIVNFPPFNYQWDTERESNGWHELEAWAIDSTDETHKTGKLRVFVNNNHGDTFRSSEARLGHGLVTSNPAVSTVPISTAAGPKGIKVPGARAAGVGLPMLPAPIVAVGAKGAGVGSPAPIKPMSRRPSLVAGVQDMQPPSPVRVASASDHPGQIISIVTHVPVAAGANRGGSKGGNVTGAASLIEIAKGTRLPNWGTFEVALNSDFIDFHGVMPRIDDGVPMTPLRFLLEKAGGKVNWENPTKTVRAKTADHDIMLRIGDELAYVNTQGVSLERAPYIDRGRTIVPLSFIRSTLDVNVQYDKDTNHVLITSLNK